MAAPARKKRLARATTLQVINQYMDDAEVDKAGDLDLITFICAAQAAKPGVDTNDLMNIFNEYDPDNSDEEEEAVPNLVHKLLKKVESQLEQDTEETPATPINIIPESPSNFSYLEDDDSEDDSEEEHFRSLRRTATMQAANELGKAEEKFKIAEEMLATSGMSIDLVATVTGIPVEELRIIHESDVLVSPRVNKQSEEQNGLMNEKIGSPGVTSASLNSEDVASLMRLTNGGQEAVAASPELAHRLLCQLKDYMLGGGNNLGWGLPRQATMEEEEDEEEEILETPTTLAPSMAGAPRTNFPKRNSIFENTEIPIEHELFEVIFETRPLGMSWNQTSDGKNLYVQDIANNGAAARLGVTVGSVIHSFNETVVYDQGPETIYTEFKRSGVPVMITFKRPTATGPNDPKVIILRQVTGLETDTVIKLLHKFNGNVQAANEAFYIAKAKTKQWIEKQKAKSVQAPTEQPLAPAARLTTSVTLTDESPLLSNDKKKGKKNWWKSWVNFSNK